MFRRGRLSSVKRKKREGMPGGAPLHPFFYFACVPLPFVFEPLPSLWKFPLP